MGYLIVDNVIKFQPFTTRTKPDVNRAVFN